MKKNPGRKERRKYLYADSQIEGKKKMRANELVQKINLGIKKNTKVYGATIKKEVPNIG